MELMQLQMFVAAAEAGSLQKAAERVNRTPQAVSMGIGKLEQKVGVPLLARSSSRGIRLTSAGEVFVDYAKKSLSILSEGLVAVREISSAKRGQLRIGANQSIGEYFLPHLTHTFGQHHPNIKIKILIGYTEAILGALRCGDVDIALAADKAVGKEFQSESLLTDRLVAIMNPTHRLAYEKSTTLYVLAAEPLILLTEASELRGRISGTFQRHGIPLNLHVETGTLDSIKRLVIENVGIGIVPALCVTKEDGRYLVVKTIDEFGEDRSLWIVYPNMPSAACQEFITLLRASSAKN